MTPIDIKVGPIGTAIACGAILSSLLDVLVAKGTLTTEEVRTVLQSAETDLGVRTRQDGGPDAQRIVFDLLRKFPQSHV
jgi:polyhydroxyalkanoate synthesis regulator phasin